MEQALVDADLPLLVPHFALQRLNDHFRLVQLGFRFRPRRALRYQYEYSVFAGDFGVFWCFLRRFGILICGAFWGRFDGLWVQRGL